MPWFIWTTVSMQKVFSLVLISTSFSLWEKFRRNVFLSRWQKVWLMLLALSKCPGDGSVLPNIHSIGGFPNWKTSAAPPLSIQNSKSRSYIFNIFVHHNLRKCLLFSWKKMAKSSQTFNLNDCIKYCHHMTLSFSFLFS